MFFDMNINASFEAAASSVKQIQQKQCREGLIADAIRFGYRGVAFNVTLDVNKGQLQRHVCPIPQDAVSFPAAASSSASSLMDYLSGFRTVKQFDHVDLSMNRQGAGSAEYRKDDLGFVFLRRATLVYSHPNNVSSIQQFTKTYPEYDILAVRPTDEKTWMSACQSCDCDLISIDFSQGRVPFTIRRAQLNVAVR